MSRMSNTSADEVEPNEEEAQKWASSADAFEETQAAHVTTRRRRHRGPPKVEKEWYSKAEAAQYLGVAEITFTRYLERGILHARRLPTPGAMPSSSEYDYGRLRIHKSELDRYLVSVDRHPADAQTSPAGWDANRSGREGNDVAKTSVGGEPDGEEELARMAQVGDTEALERLRRADLIMTREDAALQLGVSWRTIKRYFESGRLRFAGYFRCPDSYTRAHVFRSDVERLLDSGEAPEGTQSQTNSGETD